MSERISQFHLIGVGGVVGPPAPPPPPAPAVGITVPVFTLWGVLVIVGVGVLSTTGRVAVEVSSTGRVAVAVTSTGSVAVVVGVPSTGMVGVEVSSTGSVAVVVGVPSTGRVGVGVGIAQAHFHSTITWEMSWQPFSFFSSSEVQFSQTFQPFWSHSAP